MTTKQEERTNDELARLFRPDRECINVGGEAVYIQEMSGEEALDMAGGSKEENRDFVYRMIARCVVDKDGKRRFEEKDVTEIKRWGQRKLRVIIRTVLRINGLDEEPEKKLRRRPERRLILHLAIAMGRPNVAGMLREIGSEQLHEWIAFAGLEGFGDRRADLRMGILASLIANVHRDAKKKASPYRPADFMPRIKEDDQRIAEAELKMRLSGFAARTK